jgi:sec-independent protein translocase protein TatB
MSAAELLLILIVALLVFGPSKMPMLARHLAKSYRLISHYQQQVSAFLQEQLKEQQLQDNLQKAKKADDQYQQKSDSSKSE